MVIKVMKELYKEGGMPDVLPDAENYFKKMIKTGVFVDMPFFCMAAIHLNRDIVIVHVHPSTVDNGLFNWIRGGGEFGSDKSATGCPIFLGIYLLKYIPKYQIDFKSFYRIL